MEQTLKIGRELTGGAYLLFVGNVLSTAILAIGAIIMGRYIPEKEYGLYAVAMIPTALIILFQDWGVGSAMTKYCAQFRSKNMESDLRKLIQAGLLFQITTGTILTLISMLIANFLASSLWSKPEAGVLILIVSTTVLSRSLLTGGQSIFMGFERMKLISVTVICQAVCQSVLSPLLVFFGYGAFGAVVGYTASTGISAILTIFLLYFEIFKRLPKTASQTPSMIQDLKLLLRFGFPLGISVILSGILASYYSFLMAFFVDATTIGNYGLALNFVMFITFFTIPISQVLFPAFSRIDPKEEPQLLNSVFASSVKYSSLFFVPVAMGLVVLSGPLINTVFGEKWLIAPLFLSLASIVYLFNTCGPISNSSLLSALGETKFLLKVRLLPIVIGVPTSFFLVSHMGIPGLILSDIVDTFPGMVITAYWIYKNYGVITDFKSSGKILLASAAAAALTFLFTNVFTLATWLMLTIGAVLFLVTYLVTLPLIGAINQIDVNNLKALFSGMGIISRILQIPLALMEKLTKVLVIKRNSGTNKT